MWDRVSPVLRYFLSETVNMASDKKCLIVVGVLMFFDLSSLPTPCEGALKIRFEENKQKPDNEENIKDDLPNTCAEFTVNKDSPNTRDTTLRVEVPDSEAEIVDVSLVGKNLSCDYSLFVIPITEVEKAKWTGIWIVCDLLDTQKDNFERCSYRCQCAGGCEEIQIMKRPRDEEEYHSWSLCQIQIGQKGEVTEKSPTPECETEDGWTVILKRCNGSVDFDKTWDEYKHSFGSCETEFWTGNDFIHNVTTSEGIYSLRVNLTSTEGKQFYAEYRNFSIGSEKEGYEFRISAFDKESSEVNLLMRSNNCKFSTKDKDQDGDSNNNFAKLNKAPWWYCTAWQITQFTGPYDSTGIKLEGFTHTGLAREITMMIRRN